MSIYPRGVYWWCDFTAPDGKRIQRSLRTKDKREAQELHDQIRAGLWRQKNLGEKPRRKWQEAVVRWLNENLHKKSLRSDKMHLRFLDKHLNKVWLDQIDLDLLQKIRQDRIKNGAGETTANRMMALVRAILNKAKSEWEWIDKVPAIKLVPEPKKRVRWLTKEEVVRLLAELPEHLAAMAQFSLATGLRESNVTGLTWAQIDLPRQAAWVYADQAKAGKEIAVPLNEQACAIVSAQFGRHPEYVFTYDGKPVTRCNTKAWRNALARAGIKDFRWHDLRHTWASWHIQAGTPLHILQELGGWESAEMVKKYAHLGQEHLSRYAHNTLH